MKYVIVEKDNLELPVIFHDAVRHSDAVDRRAVRVVSAGFCGIGAVGDIKVWGESDSLGVGCRFEDGGILAWSLRNLGIGI